MDLIHSMNLILRTFDSPGLVPKWLRKLPKLYKWTGSAAWDLLALDFVTTNFSTLAQVRGMLANMEEWSSSSELSKCFRNFTKSSQISKGQVLQLLNKLLPGVHRHSKSEAGSPNQVKVTKVTGCETWNILWVMIVLIVSKLLKICWSWISWIVSLSHFGDLIWASFCGILQDVTLPCVSKCWNAQELYRERHNAFDSFAPWKLEFCFLSLCQAVDYEKLLAFLLQA